MKTLDIYLKSYQDSNEYSKLVVDKVANNPESKKAWLDFEDALHKIAHDFDEVNPVESAANYIEAVAMELIFKEAFRQGASFMLDLMNSNKEVTSL